MIRFADNRFVSNPGSPIKETFKPIVNKDGSITLIHEGYINTDEEIMSHEMEVNIDVIIARYMNGDLDALNKHVGMYGDFTNMPKTYAEVLQLQIDSKRAYDSLPAELKEKFNNDPNEFFAQSGSEEWYEKLKSVLPAEEIKEEVKVEE